MNGLRGKIKYIFDQSNLSQAEFARRLGITEAYVSKLFRSKDIINVSKPLIKLICYKFNVNEEWLLTGEGEKYISTPPADDFRETVCIPLIGTVPAGFPEMPPEEDQIIDYICLPDVPRKSFAIIVKGESMSPTVRDGDYALFIKAGKFDVKNGDLIIARNEWNELLLKRYRSKDNQILLTSDNLEYKPITPNEHYKIVGKVIRIVRDIKF